MKSQDNSEPNWRRAAGGALLCLVLGLMFFRWGNESVLLSYDLLFLPGMHRSTPPPEAIVIYIDDNSFQHLGQTSVPTWDRNLHAQLVDRMTADRARVVVFDIVFHEPGTTSANANFSRAIRENGKVVLAASLEAHTRGQILTRTPKLPLPEFLEAPAAGWGITEAWSSDDIARQYFTGNELQPSMPWVAAKIAGAAITKAPGATEPDTWLNFYGPSRFLRWFSYLEATNQPAGFFRDKCVFVGAGPKTLKAFEEADVFATPHRRWRGHFFPGVELGATAFLNLLRNEGLKEWSPTGQFLLLSLTGLIVGAGLTLLRPWGAAGLACFCLLSCAVAATLAARHDYWFSWTVIAFVQVPCGLAWSIGEHYYRLKFQKDVLTRTLEETTKLVEATKATAQQQKRPAQLIPDHAMIKRVGKGAYGEVWLARNAIGAYHAVKITRRAGFPAEEPYEREFHGIQKFMPISRSHAGFVHILHVGRDDDQRLFYCIMEAGDDKTAGQKIDPDTYTPKTLASELDWRGKLTPEETLRLGLALADALEHLHQHRLIHRDIKPANIIYVNGTPKFADIGLVTEIRSVGKDVSFLGTEGYIAPEGPGTASADVYALGKVLYEAAMGRDRRLYPEVPTSLFEESESTLIRQLNNVINRACETAANERYQSAAALHVDLLKLQRSTV